MTVHQRKHFDRLWMKNLKREFELNKKARDAGFTVRLDPKRLPA